MSFRTRVSILSSVLVVLIVTFVLGTVFSPRARRARAVNRPLVEGIAPEEIGEIQFISDSDESSDNAPGRVVVRRRGEQSWAVGIDGTFFPARSSRLSGFLDALSGLRTLRSVTDDPELYGEFEIGRSTADRLVLETADGLALATLYFGKSATQSDRVYVRSADDPTVYMTQNSVSFYFREGGTYWAELAVLPRSLGGNAVQRISIEADIAIGEPSSGAEEGGAAENGSTGPERRVANFTVFRGDDGNWRFDDSFTLPEDARIDQTAVDRWASNIVDFEASSYADQSLAAGKTGLDAPNLSVSIDTDAGREYRLNVGSLVESAGDQFYVRADGPDLRSGEGGQAYLFEASTFSIRRLFRAPDDIYSTEEEQSSG